ncbi:MAG: type IV conjugative transfer system coupling protein TraD [Azonexus sp.]|jgi:conjugal transfer pilus assembly protein TraD|nr:type IV conjugative transfer system coupling protein TraD [Azonexus sp.]
MAYPLEAQLRPPYEWLSSTIFAIGAVLLAFDAHSTIEQSWFVFPPEWGLPIALILITLSMLRFFQGLKVIQYQRNLRTLKHYILKPDEIPWSRENLFLGLGFQWDQRHTQRLYDSREPNAERYTKQSGLYQKARKFEIWAEHRPQWANLTRWTRLESKWNPVRSLPDVGGDPCIHGVEPDESEVMLALSNRVGHMLVLGTTRVGKTRYEEIFVTQDIRRGDVVIVFDPKGDLELLMRMFAEAKRADRLDHFYVFHLGYPDISARYNPVGSFERITEVATRTSDPLPDEGNSAAFKEFVWRFINVLAKAMFALGERPDFTKLYAYAVDTEALAVRYIEHWLDREHDGWRDEFDYDEARDSKDRTKADQARKTGRTLRTVCLVAFVREKELREPVAEALMSVLGNDRTYFEKLVSSLYPLMEKLTTGKTAELIAPDYDDLDDDRPILDWLQVINSGGIVYVGLDSLSDHEVASAIGGAMFSDLTSVAGTIYKHGADIGQAEATPKRKLALHADEFNELVGNSFIPMVNKAGGAGYQVTTYTQTWHDVEARIGSKPKAEQIAGNFNSLVMMRVQNTETAEMLTMRLPEVNVITRTAASSASDTNDPTDFAEFASRNEDRISTEKIPTLSTADVMKLPKGQAFCLINGGQLWKIRIPLADDSDDECMPKSVEELSIELKNLRRGTRSVGGFSDGIIQEGKGHGW